MTGGTGRSPAAIYAHSLLRTSALAILSSTGFRRSSGQAADLLTEVVQRYIQLLGSQAKSAAEICNRTNAVPRDIYLALEELGCSVEEIKDWLEIEGAEERELAKQSHNAEKASALRTFNEAGKRHHDNCKVGKEVLTFGRLDGEQKQALAQSGARMSALSDGDDMDVDGEEADTDGLFSEDEARSDITSATSISAGSEERNPRPPHIPEHLPPLPTFATDARIPESSSVQEITSACDGKSGKDSEEESKKAGDEHLKNVIRDVWRETVPFRFSRLREDYVDLPNDLPEASGSSTSRAPRASSLHAFAADFVALQQERGSSASAGIRMTPEDAQHAPIRGKRRRIAAVLADPTRFMPVDSLHAALPVRPAAHPFIPSPSMLITLPSDGSAPVFTPTNPHGRTVSLLPPSGAAQPILGYRWPSQLQGAVRTVAELDVQRRVARLEDPPPLYDSQHVERVFRGAPASRQLLGMAHSALAPALNLLAVQQKRKLGSEAEDEDLELPSKGTLVYTWDWTTKDPFDSQLPGKRIEPLVEQRGKQKSPGEATMPQTMA